MEHILREIGVQPAKRFNETNDDVSNLKEENEELKLQVNRLENTLDELQLELQNVRRLQKMQKQKVQEAEKTKSLDASANMES
jgi:predicted RNase H-like nuclease (RuvC/YqgF family)